MVETAANADGWVLARLAALERANRQLWIGIGALAMTLVSVAILGFFLATSSGTGDAAGGNLVAQNLTLSGALRVVDEAGRNLVWIGREPAPAGKTAGSGQAVIGLFAGTSAAASQQTIRLATSPLGSALSLSTPDGADSVSAFAGGSGVSLELRRGEVARTISERADGASAARTPVAKGSRAESPAIAREANGESERGSNVDLSDPALQPLGAGFYVGRLSLSDQSGVLRVSGRIVNATSIDQLRAEFRLTVAGRELPFSVGRIAAGSSTAFTVELPSASASALRAARMRWVRSTLSYMSE